MDKISVSKILTAFGLSNEEQEVYLALLKLPQATPLLLSRDTGINRTTLYRVLETLLQKGLVKEVMDYKSKSFRASPTTQLELLVAKKESEIEYLREQIPFVTQALQEVSTPTPSPTRVLYFKGVAGLRQLLYNTLQANDEVVGYGYGNWNNNVGRHFAEKIRQEYVDKSIGAREILNVTDDKGSYTSVNNYFNRIYQYRQIAPKILTITHDTYIYNDVFAFYHAIGEDLFGVEIYNSSIVNTQKQLFEILWKIAKSH